MTSRANGMKETDEQMNSRRMIPKPPQAVAMIADDHALAVFAQRLAAQEWIVVDTEFMRERSYYPELCLLQIASAGEIGLIDVLAIADAQPLTDLMTAPALLKVFHAADQDLEVLQHYLGTVPAPVFDTQVAAALTGLGDQISYARLVEALTDTHLPKAHTRTDWSRRPLTQQELAYAADDVRYLAVAYPLLRQRLESLHRLTWAQADSAALVATAQRPAEPASAWQRLRAWHQLEPAQQQALATLAQWREEQAMQANRPRKWILADDALFALANKQPASGEQLARIKQLPAKTRKRYGAALLAAIAKSRTHAAEPLATAPEPMTDVDRKTFKKARQALAICARESGIPAPTLARRRDLEEMVAGGRAVSALQGWRAQVAGHAIVDVIEGRRRIIGSSDNAHLTEAQATPTQD